MSQSSKQSSNAADRFELEQHFELPDAVPPQNEGQTVASWFAMLGIVVGALISTVGVCLSNLVVVVVGLVVIAAALVGGVFLRLAGYGQPRP